MLDGVDGPRAAHRRTSSSAAPTCLAEGPDRAGNGHRRGGRVQRRPRVRAPGRCRRQRPRQVVSRSITFVGRGPHVPLLGDAHQRLDFVQHAVHVDGRPLHLLASRRPARSTAFFFFVAATCNSKATPPFVQLSGGRRAARPQPGQRLGDRAPQPGAAGGHALRGVARRAARQWHAGHLAASPIGRSHEVQQGRGDGQVPDRRRRRERHLQRSRVVAGHYGRRQQRRRARDARAERRLLRSSRRPVRRRSLLAKRRREPDYYSHFEHALPLDAPVPDAQRRHRRARSSAVEFYNAALDHYFLSTNPVEIDNLDSGRTVGWVRTGLRFLVYSAPAAGTSPVCRFYRAPAFGDSHFYSASPAECAQTAAAHPVDWIYESPNVFYVQLPNTDDAARARREPPPSTAFSTRRRPITATRRSRSSATRWTASAAGRPRATGRARTIPIMCATVS